MKKNGEAQKVNTNADSPSAKQTERYGGIKLLLHQLIDQTSFSFSGTNGDKALINQALDKVLALEIITEEDKFECLQAFCKLSKLYIEKFPEGEDIEEMTEGYYNCNSLLSQLYGPEALYSKVNLIIYELIGSLSKQANPEDAFETAIRKSSALPFKNVPDDDALKSKAFALIISAKLAYDWFLSPPSDEMIVEPFEKEFANLLDHLRNNGFNKDEILRTFHRVEELQKKYTGDFMLLSITLLRIYGIGILLAPQSAPALELLEDRVIELSKQYFGQYLLEYAIKTGNTKEQKSSAEIISGFKALVKKDGFSAYAFDQAVADIKKLPQETEEEFKIFQETLLKIYDIGIEYSNNERDSGSLKVAKEGFLKSMDLVNNQQQPYTAKEFTEILDQNLMELKQNLENGENPEIAITRSFTNIILLGQLMPNDEEEGEKALQVFTDSLTKDFIGIIGSYVSEDVKAVWKETVKTLGFIQEASEQQNTNEVDNAIEFKRFEKQGERLINAGLNLPISDQAASTFYIKQFIDLYPGLAIRFMDDEIDDNTNDKKEYERLKADLDDTFRLLSSAYTPVQFMQHQRVSLRRMAIELSQFERRRYLMIATPVFPANEILVDPNRVFFSGTGETATSVLNSCNTLGMLLSTKRSVSNKLHSRWEQLRSSALTIFDYSSYDPAKADPAGSIDSASFNEAEVLDAASRVATVAYENGWAYALGKPVVIITKKARPIPFDIDIEPVELEGEEKDEERIIAGIQTALYGVNRNTKGSCLSETVEYVKTVYKETEDEKVQSLLRSITNTRDATKARFTIETILDRVDEKNQMLITPAFPGGYPDGVSKKVFHVTAFRAWSKPLEKELKRICKVKGLDFKIGYERLNPEILPSIWKDITEASYVIADITNLNPNAVLELAMAQAIGRPTLILTQNKELHKYFLPVQKTRTHYYNPNESKQELIKLLENFFDGKE